MGVWGCGEGREKLQIMKTSLKDRNYRSETQVKSVTSTNQAKAPCVGHIPSALFPAQDKVYFLFVFLFFQTVNTAKLYSCG